MIREKKSQGLPLNTIVIALLVIIVLVMIIGYFVTGFGGAGEDINEVKSSMEDCSFSNSAISLVYDEDKYDIEYSEEKLDGEGYSKIIGIENCYSKEK